MRIAMTGATGFIGRATSRHLGTLDHEVVAARRSKREAALCWSVEEGFAPPDVLSGYDAVIHLAGENISSGRWTSSRKESILQSRTEGTQRVVEALVRAEPRPHTLLCASAVGFYGDSGDKERDEDAPPGRDFLADVARAWETEAQRAETLGVRVVHLRFGMVLDKDGGALAKLLPVFKIGAGGRLGDGKQYMSWVHRRDVARAIAFLLEQSSLHGPFNVCAPEPVTNREFTETLSRALHRPHLLTVPKIVLKAAMGEMADALLLGGQRARPTRLQEAGFAFDYPRLREAIDDIIASS